MKTCTWQEPDDYCMSLVEGRTEFCARHNRLIRKIESDEKKANESHSKKLEKARARQSEKKPGISKDPKKWKNTFLCSDGTKVTQAEINERRSAAYKAKYSVERYWCEGCKKWLTSTHAHIIPQARCKSLGKTELIWDRCNFFRACNACNLALENPKGNAWKSLLNIDYCLLYMKQEDPDLFTKFELAAIDQSKPTI